MSLLYFLLGFTTGATAIFIMFSLWFDDEIELREMEEFVRRQENMDSK